MLVDFWTGARVTKIPFERDFKAYMSRLNSVEIDAIKAKLNSMIDGTEIQTSSWMPGADWTGTVFQPIYEKAAFKNFENSAKCFGLMVWQVFQERPERWTSGRFEKDGEPISGRTYFIPKN